MNQATTGHPLSGLHRALREADLVLVPVDPAVESPFAAGATDVLQALCASPLARAWIARAGARWAVSEDAPCEPMTGLAVFPLSVPRSVAGSRFAAVTVLDEALGAETIDQLAHSARLDATIARRLVEDASPWTRRSMRRIARLAAALARSESERIAGADAGERLSAAWEELHLLHSLSGGMTVGASPRAFAERALAELRATLGCRWTALRVEGVAGEMIDVEGGVLAAGMTAEQARRALSGHVAPARAVVVGSDLILAPVRREGSVFGLLVAGDRMVADGADAAMSNWERTLVETAAGHLAVFLDNARLYRDLDAMFMGSLSALVSAIDAKDPYTRGHSQRVAMLSRLIGETAGLSGADLKQVHMAGLVHDVGKIGMPEAILRKQSRLTDEEFAAVKQHPEIGYRILRDIPQFAPVLGGVRHHHERIDGRGYPHGLAGDAIPLFARIIAIADTFDAMSSTRTYRAAKPREAVLAEMQACAGTQLDPRLLACFRRIDLRAYDALNAAHAADMMKEAA
ncbi:MAG: Cyclic di-GMP phosphodiesterase response regulator RpfG [Planctomycetota bacterium]